MTSLRGRLLVAEPTLQDPNFSRSVVYVIEHSGAGALGVVLNRPGEVAVRDAIPSWAPYLPGAEHVFRGGPVSPEGAICLARHRSDGPGEGLLGLPDDAEPEDPAPVLRPITRTVAALDLHADPAEVRGGMDAARVFAGYAGWSGGQLEGELDAGGWYVLRATDADVFCERPDRLWHDVLARQRGHLRAVAHYPEDPSVN